MTQMIKAATSTPTRRFFVRLGLGVVAFLSAIGTALQAQEVPIPLSELSRALDVITLEAFIFATIAGITGATTVSSPPPSKGGNQ